MRPIYDVITVIHTLVDRAEVDMNYYLDKAAAINSVGWSTATLPMMWLADDANRLRAMAERLDQLHSKMKTPEPARKELTNG